MKSTGAARLGPRPSRHAPRGSRPLKSRPRGPRRVGISRRQQHGRTRDGHAHSGLRRFEMVVTYEPKENTTSPSHIPRRAGIERADATRQRKMRVRAQQFASKRQPQHAHGHTGQGLREPSRLQDARPKEKHFESSHAARRRGFRTTPHPQRKMRVPTRQCALETKAVRTRVGQLGFDTIQPSQTPHMKGNTHDGFALSPPPRGVRARTASGTTHRTGTTVRARNEGSTHTGAVARD